MFVCFYYKISDLILIGQVKFVANSVSSTKGVISVAGTACRFGYQEG